VDLKLTKRSQRIEACPVRVSNDTKEDEGLGQESVGCDERGRHPASLAFAKKL
jgi:hypothetical protein